ncbi:MAG: hypothetical protein CMP59_04070 [Flavobacteriales bacterium]|nr:hypothetical protein [Flavobacteriales bacterium]|tara:strand:+ start:714 stop:1622 length:909 start_codon:yes stop_codon:yes gene_type:complete
MKTLLLSFSLISVFVLNAQTSSYHEFPDSNAAWNYNFQLNCFANGTADESYSIMISGDTTINNTTYKKLSIPYLQSQSTGTCGAYAIGYKGAIREDVQAKKIYIVAPASNSEELLYDFNLAVGDTLKGYLESPIGVDVIQSVDSILVGSSFRKRWEVNSCYNIYFIEGIGSTYGLIEPSPGCVSDLPDFSLICFQENGRSLLPDTTSSCNLITSLQEQRAKVKTTFYPNPFSTYSKLQFDRNLLNASLSITDLNGKLVKRIENINGDNYTFYANELSEGVYIARIEENGDVLSTKKIVILGL